jgi:hypothetical protein
MVALINNAIRPEAHAKALGKAWIWFGRSGRVLEHVRFEKENYGPLVMVI